MMITYAQIKMAKLVESIWGPVPAPRRRCRVGARLSSVEAKAARVRARKRSKAPAQMSLGEVVTWGGRRAGAGRKAARRRPTPHHKREVHAKWNPVHVTLRRAEGLPSLRSQVLEELVRHAIDDTCRARGQDFRVTHYSIQTDHLHLMVEADGHEALSRGMRSLSIRIALRMNGLLRRPRGRVFAHRHHRHELLTPSEVRHALVYVLNNYRKHGAPLSRSGDPFSSARWFTGWLHAPALAPDPPTRDPCTWLLREGWLTVGFGPLHIAETPRPTRS